MALGRQVIPGVLTVQYHVIAGKSETEVGGGRFAHPFLASIPTIPSIDSAFR